MRKTIKHYLLASDDTALLALYAACWLLAFFTHSDNQLGLLTAGHVLSAVAATLVALLWIVRPSARLGGRWRDIWVAVVVLIAAFEAYRSPIRSTALLDLLQTLEMAAIFITAAYLCARRPQPFFLITLLMLAGATAISWRWQRPLFPTLDPILLCEITALVFLAVLPWLAVGLFRTWERWYHWLVLAAAVAVAALEAAGGLAGRSNWFQSLSASLSAEARQVMASILSESWLVGCGPGHYEWLFRASMPEEFAGQVAMAPTALLVLIEGGAVGLAAMLAFGLAMLWRFRPGRWAVNNEAVLDLARPLRWVAAFVFLFFLATPVLRSTFGQIVLWSLLGMLRAWSSERCPAAVSLVAKRPDEKVAPSAGSAEPSWKWQQSFLVVGTILAGIGLVAFHIRPLVGAVYRRCPPNILLSDPGFLDRIELARWWWPYESRTHELEAAHYRAKANAGQSLSNVEIKAATLAYERMIRSNPYDPMSHATLARWEMARGNSQKAIEVARRGLVYCPASFELQYLLAGCYRRLDNVNQTKAEYLRAHQTRPRSTPVLLNLADLELRQGNTRAAQHYLRLARQILPNDRAIDALLKAIGTGQTKGILDQLEKDTDSRDKAFDAR
jgi:hypothetical protein